MNAKPNKGFTLLEIMVVVVIIGLAASIVAMSVGSNDPATLVRKEAQTWVDRTNYLLENAVLKGDVYGFFLEEIPLTEAGQLGSKWCYQWRSVRDRQWRPLSEMPTNHCLDEAFTLEVLVDEKAWKFDPELEYQEPVFVIYPSGELSAWIEIHIDGQTQNLASDSLSETISIDMLGELYWDSEDKRLGIERDKRSRRNSPYSTRGYR